MIYFPWDKSAGRIPATDQDVTNFISMLMIALSETS